MAVGLGLVLAYRLSVEIYDRREFHRFEKERQHLNWKQVMRLPLPPLGGVTGVLLSASPSPDPPHSFHITPTPGRLTLVPLLISISSWGSCSSSKLAS